MRHHLSLLILATALRVSAAEIPTFSPTEFNVRDFGARGNGKDNDTAPINAAIEKCSSGGGGTVLFPAGVYSAASIHLRSNVRLLLDAEAVIRGAADGYDQPEPGRKHRELCHHRRTHRRQPSGGGRCRTGKRR
ncbi:MAG: hypothetical protein DME46_01955 [Verrucomicrobia bacterium]|nr:MAG: hypothetical protein DME46_01955 [Verrucomicrobiota bacterium]